jgi:hypothetical protein
VRADDEATTMRRAALAWRREQAAAAPLVELGAAAMRYNPRAPEARNIALAAERISGVMVLPGAEASFLSMLGEISRRTGFVAGEALVGGDVQQSVGGGICVVSTLLYRAAFVSGLQIVERQGHSRLLSMFDNPPGMDAAVYTPDGDFRWKNTTAAPLEIRAALAPDTGTITVALWGHADGRTSSVDAPIVRTLRPLPAVWTFDPTLPADAIREVRSGQGGAVATVTRTVRGADGAVLATDRVVSSYQGVPAAIKYGRAVVPPRGVLVLSTPEPTPTPSPTPIVSPTARVAAVAAPLPTSASSAPVLEPTLVPSPEPAEVGSVPAANPAQAVITPSAPPVEPPHPTADTPPTPEPPADPPTPTPVAAPAAPAADPGVGADVPVPSEPPAAMPTTADLPSP